MRSSIFMILLTMANHEVKDKVVGCLHRVGIQAKHKPCLADIQGEMFCISSVEYHLDVIYTLVGSVQDPPR